MVKAMSQANANQSPSGKADILILGGGASGLFAAAVAARAGVSVTVLEKDARVGKKLLQTGNGRCNLTNTVIKTGDYNADLSAYFSRFGQKGAEAFFASLGLEIYYDEAGRAYPVTNAASSVLNVLRFECDRRGVCFITEFGAENIYRREGLWVVSDGGRGFAAESLFIACGGGDGGTRLLNALNVGYKSFVKSLCALKAEKPTGLDGLRADVEVTCGGFCEKGQIQFKKDAVSGIVIFNLSAHLARRGDFSMPVRINFLPMFSDAELTKRLMARRETLSNEPCARIFTGMLQSVLGQNILSRCGVCSDAPASALSGQDIEKLAKCVQYYAVQVVGTTGENQAFCGGVPLAMLTANLEHKALKGLYFIGEIADADGVCGGYNLQWAWTSAYLAATDACQSSK